MNEPNKIVVKVVLISGWIACILSMMTIIGTALYLHATHQNVPSELNSWVGQAITVLALNFFAVIREYLGVK